MSDLPPSAKYVRHVLANQFAGEAPRRELVETVELRERTIDDAIGRLEAADGLTRARFPRDLPVVVCRLSDRE